MAFPFLTIGHSTRTIPEFVELLRVGGAQLVVDVRTIPRSRTNPQFNEDALGGALAEYQIGHARIPALGGLRKRVRDVPPDVNGWWANQSFHNYADHALSDAFSEGLDELVLMGSERPLAVMCSEAVWWRCHRRIIADHLIARGEHVRHLMGAGKVDPARLSEGAQILGGRLVYPKA